MNKEINELQECTHPKIQKVIFNHRQTWGYNHTDFVSNMHPSPSQIEEKVKMPNFLFSRQKQYPIKLQGAKSEVDPIVMFTHRFSVSSGIDSKAW